MKRITVEASGIKARVGCCYSHFRWKCTDEIDQQNPITSFHNMMKSRQRYHTTQKNVIKLIQSRIRTQGMLQWQLAIKANILQVSLEMTLLVQREMVHRTNKNMGNLAGHVSSLRAFKLYYRYSRRAEGRKGGPELSLHKDGYGLSQVWTMQRLVTSVIRVGLHQTILTKKGLTTRQLYVEAKDKEHFASVLTSSAKRIQ